jgi:hypothetical protein
MCGSASRDFVLSPPALYQGYWRHTPKPLHTLTHCIHESRMHACNLAFPRVLGIPIPMHAGNPCGEPADSHREIHNVEPTTSQGFQCFGKCTASGWTVWDICGEDDATRRWGRTRGGELGILRRHRYTFVLAPASSFNPQRSPNSNTLPEYIHTFLRTIPSHRTPATHHTTHTQNAQIHLPHRHPPLPHRPVLPTTTNILMGPTLHRRQRRHIFARTAPPSFDVEWYTRAIAGAVIGSHSITSNVIIIGRKWRSRIWGWTYIPPGHPVSCRGVSDFEFQCEFGDADGECGDGEHAIG